MSTPAAEQWARERTFHHSAYPPRRIAAERERSVSVCLPARDCASTVGEIVTALSRLRDAGAIDEVVVVDAASRDGTARIAQRAGARVLQEGELASDGGDLGPVLGKGDAMWRALPHLAGELIVFLDADSEGFSEHFAAGLLGPLVCEPGVRFVKAYYRRPFEHDGVRLPEGGGRVNHLLARPALSLLYPDLAAVRQPLAGEVAATRELLERVPFATGYAVEIAMLIDVWRTAGLDAIAQVDLDVHRNRHQPLPALSEMARTVLATMLARLPERTLPPTALAQGPIERPPLAAPGTADPVVADAGEPDAAESGAAELDAAEPATAESVVAESGVAVPGAPAPGAAESKAVRG